MADLDRSDEMYRAAHSMFMHEQTRWNAWSLFFVSLYVGLFWAVDKFRGEFPWVLAYGLAILISFLWLRAILGMRRSTACWFNVLLVMESNTTVMPYSLFSASSREYSVSKDFRALFAMDIENFFAADTPRRFVCLRSVTGTIALLACVLFVLFSLLEFVALIRIVVAIMCRLFAL